jgi:hypothetical protein
MTDWKTYKGQTPWACISPGNSTSYNEGSSIAESPIVSGGTAVWKVGETGVAITTTHNPCKYWYSQKQYAVIQQMGYYSVSETSAYTDPFTLSNLGLIDESLSTIVVPAMGPKSVTRNSVGVSLSQTGSVSEIVLIGTNHYNVLVPRNYVSPSNQFSVMSSMYNGNYTERQLFTSPVFVVDTVAKWQIRLKIASPFLCKWIKITFPNEWGVSLNAGFCGSYYADIANIQVL